MRAPSKKKIEEDLNFHVVTTALQKLTSMRRSKYTPEGGYRRRAVYSFKEFGDLDIISVHSRVLQNDEEGTNGRLVVFSRTTEWTPHIIEQYNKILRGLHKYTGDGIYYEYERDLPHGPSIWMLWKMID